MNPTTRNLLIAFALAALGALGYWAWHLSMEKVWEAVSAESEVATRNRMLAATLLLREGGRKVTVAGSLGELALDKLPDGTLLLADVSGVMEPDKAATLLAWVARGNTLVAQPRFISPPESDLLEELAEDDSDTDEEAAEDAAAEEAPAADAADAAAAAAEDASVEEAEEELAEEEPDAPLSKEAKANDSKGELVETDPIAARLGVRMFLMPFAPCATKGDKRCKPGADGKRLALVRTIEVPGTGYNLEMDAGRNKLISMPGAAAPLWSDAEGSTVRVYQEGRGKLVMVADDFFNNSDLRDHDHAELLLALAALNQTAPHFTIVQNLDAVHWHKLLWKNYSMMLIALAALLALLFWAAVRRFGPVLPQPVVERRSLMEHIDASGAWLWKAKDGRDVLLAAAREDTLAVIRRRAPGLFRLTEQELVSALARMCELPEDQVAQALHQAPAPTPLHFTRQIRILQELRNHHER